VRGGGGGGGGHEATSSMRKAPSHCRQLPLSLAFGDDHISSPSFVGHVSHPNLTRRRAPQKPKAP